MVLISAAFALLYTYVFWKGEPIVWLESDLANIASMAASTAHPEFFKEDPVFSHPSNFSFYPQLHIHLIQIFTNFTGNFTSAALASQPLVVFLHLTGFYFLGKRLFNLRTIALSLTLLSTFSFFIFVDYAGLFPNPLPRSIFTALLPWLLLLTIHSAGKPALWPATMFAAGIMMFFHPVSAPSIGFGVWMGWIPFLPKHWSVPQKTGWMVICGLTFIAGATPFLLQYLGSFEFGKPGLPFDEFMVIFQFRLKDDLYLKPHLTGFNIFKLYVAKGLLPAGIAALLAMTSPPAQKRFETIAGINIRQSFNRLQPVVMMVFYWALGVTTVSWGVASMDAWWGLKNNRMPFQLDLIRGLRYVPVFLMMLCLFPAAAISSGNRKFNYLIPALVLLFSLFKVHHRPFIGFHETLQTAIRLQAPDEIIRGWSLHLDLLKAIQQKVPIGEKILPGTGVDGMLIRAGTLRPVAYTKKEGNILIYGNHAGLRAWYKLSQRMEFIDCTISLPERLALLRQMALDTGSSYLAVYSNQEPLVKIPDGLKPLYANQAYLLFHVENQTFY